MSTPSGFFEPPLNTPSDDLVIAFGGTVTVSFASALDFLAEELDAVATMSLTLPEEVTNEGNSPFVIASTMRNGPSRRGLRFS